MAVVAVSPAPTVKAVGSHRVLAGSPAPKRPVSWRLPFLCPVTPFLRARVLWGGGGSGEGRVPSTHRVNLTTGTGVSAGIGGARLALAVCPRPLPGRALADGRRTVPPSTADSRPGTKAGHASARGVRSRAGPGRRSEERQRLLADPPQRRTGPTDVSPLAQAHLSTGERVRADSFPFWSSVGGSRPHPLAPLSKRSGARGPRLHPVHAG